MSAFRKRLQEHRQGNKKRRWLFVPYDQLSAGIGPLAQEDPTELGIVIVENPWKAARRPYHKQKLALIIANLRQFALEQAARGVAVEHLVAGGPYRETLQDAAKRLGPLRVMRPAERELRVDLQPLFASGGLIEIPHEGWLTTTEQFRASHPKAETYLLERFYRFVRKQTGVLMHKGEPEGGQFNFDKENRSPYYGEPPTKAPPDFPGDPIKEEVGDIVNRFYGHHPGRLDLASLPTTDHDAERHWAWAKRFALPSFGKYEDAMHTASSTLFHTRISALMNIHRLLPRQILSDVVQLDIPIAGKEGFVRQILGWREFMHHVHEATDGFRKLPQGNPPTIPSPEGQEPDLGAVFSALGAQEPLPPAFWGKTSGLNCLDTVINDVWSEGWSHHITRLMILSNLATLLDVSPRELTDWFWVAYVDAYDWVVEPNVMGLGTFATGHLFTTKPYVSGANYIHRMSNYCEGCRFVPGKTCPFTPLYWAFLDRHRSLLESNQRLRMLYRGIGSKGRHGQDLYERAMQLLLAGEELTPENIGASKGQRGLML